MKLTLSEDDMERLNEGRNTVSYTDDKEVVIKMIPPKQHGLDHAYVMTPHVVTEMSENIHSMDLPDEEKSQGFHRKAAEVECLCGETWHGDGAWKKFRDHLDDV